MNFLRLFPLIGLFALSLAAPAQAGLQRQYDEFSGETQVELLPDRLKGFHNLYLNVDFAGKGKAPDKEHVVFGFVISNEFLWYHETACVAESVPKLIIDGERRADDGTYTPKPYELAGAKPPSMVFFEFLNMQEMRKLAQAKEIRVRICNQAALLTEEDMANIRKFVQLVDGTTDQSAP